MGESEKLEAFVDERAKAGFEEYCKCVARYQPTDLGDPALQWDNVDSVAKLAFKAFAERVVRYE